MKCNHEIIVTFCIGINPSDIKSVITSKKYCIRQAVTMSIHSLALVFDINKIARKHTIPPMINLEALIAKLISITNS